jgi:hypothetical protein
MEMLLRCLHLVDRTFFISTIHDFRHSGNIVQWMRLPCSLMGGSKKGGSGFRDIYFSIRGRDFGFIVQVHF